MPNIGFVYRSDLSLSIGLGLWLLLGSIPFAFGDEIRPNGSNAYQIVTGDDSEDDRRRWDKVFSTRNFVYGTLPAAFLRENGQLLKGGRALDVAMGEGRNAVYLASLGFHVDGVDISEVALRKAKRLAREKKVVVNTIIADLTHYKLKPETYNLIINFDYLQRSLIPEIKKGLKKKGFGVF